MGNLLEDSFIDLINLFVVVLGPITEDGKTPWMSH